jgi:HEAT repeat protein
LSQTAKLKDARVVGPLLGIATDRDSGIRYLALTGLGEFPGDARVVEPLIHGLTDPDPSVRRTAGRALERIKTTKVFDALMSAAKNPDRDVAYVAEGTLRNIAAEEIEQLRSAALGPYAQGPHGVSPSPRSVPKKAWWQFWK